MDTIRLLVADPNPKSRSALLEICSGQGWMMDEALDGIMAIKMFRRSGYRLVLLNPALPELDGRNVLIQLRNISDVPIFLLCEDPSETQCLDCYGLGADDVVRVPFSNAELAARIKVFLRRTGTVAETKEPMLAYKGLYIDTFSHTVYVNEKPVILAPRQYALLAFLSAHPNRVFTREALLDEVWGEEFAGTARTVDTHVKAIRQRIEPYGHYLVTVWGYGYKFEPV